METNYYWVVTVGLVTSSVIAASANSFLLFVFVTRRGLRTVPNRFVINLLLTNLLSSILLISLLLADQQWTNNAIMTTSTKHRQKINHTMTHLQTRDIVQEELFKKRHTGFIDNNFSTQNNVNNIDDTLLCYFSQAATSFVCTASIFSILIIGVNQYFGVIHSLRYHFYINKWRSMVFIGGCWFAALVCAILSSLSYNDSSLWHFCKKPRAASDEIQILSTIYAFTYFLAVILAPLAAICIIYICIYSAARQNSKRMRRSTSTSLNTQIVYLEVSQNDSDNIRNELPKVHSAPNFSEVSNHSVYLYATQVKPTNSYKTTFITNLKHKISNASLFRYREETRAAKISIIVILTVLICYVPYGLTLMLNSECIQISPGQDFIYLSLVLLVISNAISPFLFGYRNKRVKREIEKMFVSKTKNFKLKKIYPGRNRLLNESSVVTTKITKPFLSPTVAIPELNVTYTLENERKNSLKQAESGWSNYKKSSFITVPDDCLRREPRTSFSSASTQISSEE